MVFAGEVEEDIRVPCVFCVCHKTTFHCVATGACVHVIHVHVLLEGLVVVWYIHLLANLYLSYMM